MTVPPAAAPLVDALGQAQATRSIPVLLGEAPGDKRPGDRVDAPLRSLARRLVSWAEFPTDLVLPEPDASYRALRERFRCRNVFDDRDDAYPWSVRRAREAWMDWLNGEPETEPLTVVCLGRRAAAAVGLDSRHPWGRWESPGLTIATVVPHPSGRCRTYNDPYWQRVCGRVLREAMWL